MGILKISLATTALMLTVSQAFAEPARPNAKGLITASVIEEMRRWINTDIVRVSVDAQNENLTKLAQDDIDSLDKQWRTERESDDKPLIAATLSNPLSVYLARMQGQSLGLYAEIFIMDHNGLNVGQSSITSDFWQGDENKFQRTYDVSGDALFIDEPEWDDDTKTWRAQVSFTLVGAQDQKSIGAATVEVNLTELARRSPTGS